jgi:hypothetical protein
MHCLKNLRRDMPTMVFKLGTNPKSMKPAIGAIAEWANITIRLLAIMFTILGKMGTVQDLVKQSLV